MPKLPKSFQMAVYLDSPVSLDAGWLRVTAARGYVIRQADGEQSITCLLCGFTSRNPSDIDQKYCGFCHRFHEE